MVWPTRETALLQAFFDQHRIPLFWYDATFNNRKDFHTLPTGSVDALAANQCRITTVHLAEPMEIWRGAYEVSFRLCFESEGLLWHLVGGPVLMSHYYQIAELQALSFADAVAASAWKPVVDSLPVLTHAAFCAHLRVMMLALNMSAPTLSVLYQWKQPEGVDGVTRTYAMDHFASEEERIPYSEYREEAQILACVRAGDAARLENVYRALPQTKLGNMSTYPLKRAFYGGIVNTTLVTRAAIEGGLDEKAAFSLSDVYIRHMERCASLADIQQMNERMVLDFTRRVARAQATRWRRCSLAVNRCHSYIAAHTHEPLSLQTLADVAGLTPKYLSALFLKETGLPLHTYVLTAKLEEAKNLLAYTDMRYAEIAESLCFSSQSHMIAVFRKKTGMTPTAYRATFATPEGWKEP